MSEHCHPALAAAFSCFEGRQLRWALLREPAGGLLQAKGDIDVFVYASDVTDVSLVLLELGFVRLPRPGSNAHFVRYSAADGEWLWIHVQTELGFGSDFRLTAEVVGNFHASTVLAAGIRTLEAPYAFWLLLWHCFAGKGRVAPHHRSAIIAGAAAADPVGRLARGFGEALGDPAAPGRALESIRREDWKALDLQAGDAHRARAARRPPLTVRAARTARRLAGGVRHGKERRGLTAAILGPDGAGKSSLIEAVLLEIPLPAVRIKMGLSGGWMSRVRRLRVPGVVFAARAGVLWGRYLRGQYHAWRGTLVIFERYTYDSVAPHPDRLSTAGQRLARQLLGRVCPGPDLVLVLDAPGDVLHNRSGEYSAEMLEVWRQHFRTLRTRLPNCEVIDATATADEVRRSALAHIWREQTALWSAGRSSGRNGEGEVGRGSQTLA